MDQEEKLMNLQVLVAVDAVIFSHDPLTGKLLRTSKKAKPPFKT